MHVLIFGKAGQVARELARAPWPECFKRVFLGRDDCNLEQPAAAGQAIASIRPDIVINAAAYTAVDKAEAEPELAKWLNSEAPAAMASACERTGARFIHLSTDYVFDGAKSGQYVEDDRIAPLSVYGRSKANGEKAVREMVRHHVILRTSWVFAAQGSNFVRTMLRLGNERPELRIVRDQHGSPTAASDIAEAIFTIVRAIDRGEGVWGTYHFAGSPATTWFDFADAIFAAAGQQVRLVPITSDEYRTAARRPQNSVLDCSRIARDYGIAQPSWKDSLARVIEEIGITGRRMAAS